MSIELVTGHAGSAHVTSAQDGRLNAAAWGTGKYVLPLQSQFAITVDSANQVTVATGDVLLEGRHITSEAPTTLTVDSGTQGMKRNDLVCIVYAKNGQGVESAALQVVKGTESSGTPTDPAVPSGSVLDGDTSCAMALWRLPIDGISLGEPVSLFEVADELSADANYTYSISYTPSTRIIKLEGANGGAPSSALIPTADSSTFGLIKTGSGITNTSGTISVPTATTSRNGLMTSTQVSTLSKVKKSGDSVTSSYMGFGYQNSSGAWWLYFPINVAGATSARISGSLSIDFTVNGIAHTHTFVAPISGWSCNVRNGGALLELNVTSGVLADATRHVCTAWLSNTTVTFS